MIDKKNPRQESVNADSSDSEVIIDLTDEVIVKTEDDNDILGIAENMADETSKTAEKDKASKIEEDEDREARAEFDSKAPDDDHVLIIDNARDEADEDLRVMAGDETAEDQRNGNVFDLEEKIELEYELDDKEDELIDLDDGRAEDNQEFVSLVLGGSKESDQSDDDKEEPMQYHGFEPEEEDDVIPLDADRDDTREDDEKIVALAEEKPLKFESDEDLLDLEAEADLEADDDVIPLDGFNDREAENEEDFLELIDVEEDSLSEDESITEFSNSSAESELAQVNPLFNDGFEEGKSESAAPTSILGDDLEDKGLAKEVTEPILGESGEDAKFDFSLDSNAFAKQVDRLDAFLSEDSADEPEMVSLPINQAEGDEGGQNMKEPLTVPLGQIDAAIERVINEKFSAKIENIIYEVIEKAVAKEIDRLKGALIGNHRIDDNQP